MDKYCRICWNSKNWKQPTGEARNYEKGKSYVKKKGFGHEEWLFNFQWMLKGYKPGDNTSYRYGFLQPIGKFSNKYTGTIFSVLLYTVDPQGNRLFVARIDDLYVPDEKEAIWALKKIKSQGWLDIMRKEIRSLGFSCVPFSNPAPFDVFNVRFEQKKIHFFEPMALVPNGHKIWKIGRYQPLNWDDGFQPTITPIPISLPCSPDKDDDPTWSETRRTRSAIEGTEYDPRQVKLQNNLYPVLCSRHGKENIGYEKDFVDLIIRDKNQTTFIEVKTELTAKRCIRLAFGQLLEYSHYPNFSKATRLLVVSDAQPTNEDKVYLEALRSRYNLSIFYSQWNWANMTLEPEI